MGEPPAPQGGFSFVSRAALKQERPLARSLPHRLSLDKLHPEAAALPRGVDRVLHLLPPRLTAGAGPLAEAGHDRNQVIALDRFVQMRLIAGQEGAASIFRPRKGRDRCCCHPAPREAIEAGGLKNRRVAMSTVSALPPAGGGP